MNKLRTYKKELEKIKNKRGKLIARFVVEEARDKNNPLHDYFEWDNSVAGEDWRVHKARILINQIKYEIITSKNKKKEIYAYELIKTNGDSEYKHYLEIIGNKKWKNQMLLQAVKEISYWRAKYEVYSEFSPLVREIKKIERRFLKKNGRKKGKKGT